MQLWDRQAGESVKAYEAFCAYYKLSARERSIDKAWRDSAPEDHPKRAQIAPRHWHSWSTRYDWVNRADAYLEYVAEQDRLLWEERRKELREKEWNEGAEARRIALAALPDAEQFIKRQRTIVPARGDQPEREIITLSFDITALMRVFLDASRLQRLASDEPTENIGLSGAALDAAINRELARLANSGEAANAAQTASDEAAAHR